MKTYKVKKEVRYQNQYGTVKCFPVGSKLTSKDLLNERQEKGFVKDGFLEIDKKKKEGDTK